MPDPVEKPRPQPKLYRNPVVLAQEWQRRIDSGNVRCRAELARQLGFSRAYITQVLRLLRMASQAREAILALGDPVKGRLVGTHTLRSLTRPPAKEQERRILGMTKRREP